jgi:hypothetical protein
MKDEINRSLNVVRKLSHGRLNSSKHFVAEIKGFGSLGAFLLEDLGWDMKQGIIL